MTYHISTKGLETARNLIFVRDGGSAEPEAHTATADFLGNAFTRQANVMQGRFVPPLMVRQIQPDSIDHDRNILHFPRNSIGGWDSWVSGWLDGAEVVAFRYENGRAIQVGSTTVTRSVVRQVNPLHGERLALPPGMGSYRWSPDEWWRRGGVVWIAVAALDEQGQRGPWSAPVAFTVGTGRGVKDATDQATLIEADSFHQQVLNPALPVPEGLSVTPQNDSRTAEINWTPVPGRRHVIGRSYDPSFEQVETLTVADSSFMRATDVFTFRKSFDHRYRREDVITDRLWEASAAGRFGVSGIGNLADMMPEGVSFEFMSDEGGPFVRLHVAEGRSHTIQAATHSGTEASWYHVLDPARSYNIHTVMRAAAPTQLTLRVAEVGVSNMTREVTTEWTVRDNIFTPTSMLQSPGARMTQIVVRGPVQLDIRQITFCEAGTAPFAATAEERKVMLASAASHIRFHVFCKTNPWTYSMEDFLAETGIPATRGCSLPQHLRILKDLRDSPEGRDMAARVGHSILNPWIQVEPPWSRDQDWQMLGGYLCSPYDPAAPDSPEQRGAALRVSQGQIRPWQDEFDSIRIEVGNEPWNRIAAFYTLTEAGGVGGGTWNGALLDRAAEGIMAARGYDGGKFNYYLGGWSVSTAWNTSSIAASRHADYIGYADYNGGWDSGVSEAYSVDNPVAVFKMLANTSVQAGTVPPRLRNMARLVDLCRTASEGRAKPIRPLHYEAGPGYVLNGLNGHSVTAEQREGQERLMKSVAAGTATLDAFLFNAAAGIHSTNFFTLGEGEHWKARASWDRGGAFNPPYQWFCFANQHLTGRIRVLPPQVVDVLHDEGGTAQGDVVRVYLIERHNGEQALAFVNVDAERSHEVRVRLSQGEKRWTRHYMTGDLLDSNITAQTADTVSILSEQMPAGWGRASVDVTLPPGKAEVYIAAA
ncbi:MAG: hypothetical protein Q4G14_00935 [Paracoccus sp. (in: a-proteobacteria)]|uniref:hypothetical protein n=1 Tax=Paracoccus sp. TaxID=267 RepID=UPI0026E0D6C3|nr:hypothetical protein [Paracoccus sp. (in: a-proteobacteria)]MDO5611792.1 hypothetical protein [Paracoccus sp. (in: a-proteobacteria)]